MRVILTVLQGLALIALAYLCVILAIAVRINSKHTSELLMNLSETSIKLNSTLDTLNGKKGTLVQINDAIRDARLTIAHSDRLMTKQEASIDKWNGQITTTLNNVNTAVVSTTENEKKITNSAQQTLEATTDTIDNLKPVIDNLNVEAQSLQVATTAVTALVSDPEIKSTIVHADGAVTNVEGATKDIAHEVHEYVYPGPWQRVWNAVTGVGLDIGKFFLP